jgi:glucose-6-phosphate isomerase
VTIRIDELNERTLGALLYSFCCLTAITGTMMGVDAFDQPGVEEAKVYIRESLTSASGEMTRTVIAEEDENSPVNRLRRHREE